MKKKIILVTFFLFLIINYFFGFHYAIPLGENVIYRDSYYPLLVLWILVLATWKTSDTNLYKIGFWLFLFSTIYLLVDKRTVAEILMSYSLVVFVTGVILSINKLKNEKKSGN